MAKTTKRKTTGNAKMGRPSKEFPMEIVEAACQFNPTANQVLQALASQGYIVSYNTLVRAIQKLHGVTFEEFRDKRTDHIRLKLVQKAIKMALEKDNVVMLIFCLKNLCNWTDKPAENFDNAPPIVLKYKIEETK